MMHINRITFPSHIDMPEGEQVEVTVTAETWQERIETPWHSVYAMPYARILSVVDQESGGAIIPDDDSLYRFEEEALDYV